MLLASPEVQLLQISSDGRWLATVDTWSPPVCDIKHLASNEEDLRHEQVLRRDVNLKFWRLNEHTWELDSIVETPHHHPDHSFASNVFDLVTDPSGTGFATIGEDGYVRTWKLKTKTRNGLVVRDENRQPVVTWSCHHSIELERNGKTSDLDDADIAVYETPVSGYLAYSGDGSILAASQHFPETLSNLLQLIDPFDGSVRHSRPMSARGSLRTLAFSGRHLIFLADTLVVWDFITDTITYEFNFVRGGRPTHQWHHLTFLETSPSDDGIFAVAVPRYQNHGDEQPVSHLYAFSPSSREPLYETELSSLVVGLARMADGAGFVVLDNAAQLRVLRPSIGGLSLDLLNAKEGLKESIKAMCEVPDNENADTLAKASVGEEETGGKPGLALTGQSLLRKSGEDRREEAGSNDGEYEEDDRPVVTSQQLADALDSGSNALMSVEDMFWRVAALYSRKPRKMVDE
jgi:NET1-associated nuclear protein 1 (U3 small nucleolar RNA-associated protein 17)